MEDNNGSNSSNTSATYSSFKQITHHQPFLLSSDEDLSAEAKNNNKNKTNNNNPNDANNNKQILKSSSSNQQEHSNNSRYSSFTSENSPFPKPKQNSVTTISQAVVILFECPICLESIESTPMILVNCGHSICQACVSKLELSKRNSKCPICRAIVKECIQNFNMFDRLQIVGLETHNSKQQSKLQNAHAHGKTANITISTPTTSTPHKTNITFEDPTLPLVSKSFAARTHQNQQLLEQFLDNSTKRMMLILLAFISFVFLSLSLTDVLPWLVFVIVTYICFTLSIACWILWPIRLWNSDGDFVYIFSEQTKTSGANIRDSIYDDEYVEPTWITIPKPKTKQNEPAHCSPSGMLFAALSLCLMVGLFFMYFQGIVSQKNGEHGLLIGAFLVSLSLDAALLKVQISDENRKLIPIRMTKNSCGCNSFRPNHSKEEEMSLFKGIFLLLLQSAIFALVFGLAGFGLDTIEHLIEMCVFIIFPGFVAICLIVSVWLFIPCALRPNCSAVRISEKHPISDII